MGATHTLNRETVVFEGVSYHRYPESDSFTNRVYFTGSINGQAVRLHQKIYEKAHGEIPVGFHVHHIDGNPLNNLVENLGVASESEHHSQHAPEIAPKMSSGMITFWSNQTYREVICPTCGKTYKTRSTKDVRFCSSNCWNKFHYKHKR